MWWKVDDRREAGRWKVGKPPVLSIAFSPVGHSFCVVTAAPENRVDVQDFEP